MKKRFYFFIFLIYAMLIIFYFISIHINKLSFETLSVSALYLKTVINGIYYFILSFLIYNLFVYNKARKTLVYDVIFLNLPAIWMISLYTQKFLFAKTLNAFISEDISSIFITGNIILGCEIIRYYKYFRNPE